MASNNNINNQALNGFTASGGTINIAADAITSTTNISTGAGVKTTTIGSTNSTSSTTVQSGSGALNVTSVGGNLTINSGAGTLGISTDASVNTVNIGTGGAAKTINIGNTSNFSFTNITSGTNGTMITTTGGGVTIDGNNQATTIKSGTGVLSIAADATANIINVGTGAGVKTCTFGSNNSTSTTTVACGTGGINVGTSANAHASVFGSTNSTSSTTVQSGSGALAVTSTNGTLTINSGTGALSISSDASATTVNIATGGAVKTSTFGSTNSTSATTVQSGSGALAITSTNGTLTVNSGTGALGVSTDASATTISLGTGAAVKTITLGSTNSTSTTTIRGGTGGIQLSNTYAGWASGYSTSTTNHLRINNFNVLSAPLNGSSIYVGILAGNFSETGGGNNGLGQNALSQLTTGANNVAIGYLAGNNYTSSESNNIMLNSPGGTGESNTFRAGTGTGTGTGQLNKNFMHGVRGITTGVADAIAVLVDSAGQLGTVSSSIRYKENVTDMGDVSSDVLDLRPVTFDFIGKPSHKKQVGLIAEEVEQIMPSLVAYNQDGEVESVKYHDLPVLLLNELKKALKRIDILEAKIK